VTHSKEEILGKILQEERKAKKISQEKLAKLTGLDRTFISLIENGKRNPTFTTILKICLALEIEPSELFSIYEKKDPEYHVTKGGKHGRD
jgi:transcriptional regulator with XRE-family HTH domain